LQIHGSQKNEDARKYSNPRIVLIFVSLPTVPFTSKLGMYDELRSTFLAKLKKIFEQLFEITIDV